MKISYNWLKEYINLSESPEEVAHLLTQSGLEVSSIHLMEPIKDNLKGLVLGKILTCEKHPNADKLQYTQVDIGNGIQLAIVCGAPNVKAGQQVIVAPVGTTLYPYSGPNMTIKQTKIRGVMSEGMICAADEIGLGADHEGILVLDTDLPPGTPASKCLDIQTDAILTIDITPNRADACSHIGVARELRALLDRPIQLPNIAALPTNDGQRLPIQVQITDTASCPRYSGVIIHGVNIQASPEWLQTKLKAIDIQPINNIVDITNFVMFELGQPLHAFDHDQLVGHTLQVKTAQKGEQLVTLDRVTRNLTGKELMISDQAGHIAMAGVLGGKRASVSEQTQNIFLESAYFDPKAVSKTTHQQAIKTDASFRYERGTDPNNTVYALQRALFLIKQVAPNATFSNILDHYPQPLEDRKIKVYVQNITRLIGQAIPEATIKTILHHLDIHLSDEQADSFIAIVPPYRVDVTREVDLIEEILRIYGYDRISTKDHLSSSFLASTNQPSSYQAAYELSLLLTGHGYYEICTNSLTSSAYTPLLGEGAEKNSVYIVNPLSERLNVLRPSLVFSGLEVVAYNINRQQKDLKLFEFGKSYHQIENKYIENNQLGIWLTGNLEAPNWIRKPRPVTFQDLQFILVQLLNKLGIQEVTSTPLVNPLYQTGLQIHSNQQILARMGLLNQSCLQSFNIKQPVFFAELDWDWITNMPRVQLTYQAITKFPTVKRDLSLVLDQAVTFQQIQAIVNAQEESLIQDIHVFDVYEGPALEKGKKAYALSFSLQDPDKTLEEKTIHQVMQRLMNTFEKQLGAIIRE
jgi:phenylalanyl-tRNA synthetase beta chain